MNKFIKCILIVFLIIFIGVNMGITKFSPEDISGLAERLWRIESDIKNLKMERKVYFSDAMRGQKWLDWEPNFSAEMPMTFTVTDYLAKYCIIDGVVFFMVFARGITGGTASPAIFFVIPPEPVEFGLGGGCHITDANWMSGFWCLTTATRIEVYKYNASNWGLGVDRAIDIQGFYKIAE